MRLGFPLNCVASLKRDVFAQVLPALDTASRRLEVSVASRESPWGERMVQVLNENFRGLTRSSAGGRLYDVSSRIARGCLIHIQVEVLMS